MKRIFHFILSGLTAGIIFSGLSTSFLNASAAVRLPHVIDNGMVLQRNDTAQIWGWAEPGEAVRVSFLGKTYAATADADGRWMVRIPTVRKKMVGGPYVM